MISIFEELGHVQFKKISGTCEPDVNPTLQVIDASTKFRNFVLSSAEYTQNQVAFQAVDKSGCHLKVDISS